MIDRELQQALDVDPSPEFVARVRQRVASDRRSRLVRWTWPVLSTAAAAAAVAIAAVVLGGPRHAIEAPAPPIRASFVAPTGSLAAATGPREELRPPVAVPRPRPASRRPAEPEVLVSRSESLAIQRLLAGVRDGTIDPRQLPADPPAVPEIIVPPIVIPPVMGGEGARQ